jgi:hypothetical protein
MKKTTKKNLILGRETIRHLARTSLGLVAGAKNITAKSAGTDCNACNGSLNCTIKTICDI